MSVGNRKRIENDNKLIGPVVIGGVGGSGTRVLAKLVMELGIHIGAYTNKVYDYKWFGFLLNRPEWVQQYATDIDIETAFRILRKTLVGPFIFNWHEIEFLITALRYKQQAINWHDKQMKNILSASEATDPVDLDYDEKRRTSLFDKVKMGFGTMFYKKPDPSSHTGWGWKEPHSYIFLANLAQIFEQPKYIHVMRHGLDMACSPNQRQLFNWSWRYGITFDSSVASIRRNSLKYWCCANEEVFHIGRALGYEQFLPVKFEDIVAEPDKAYEQVAAFLEVRPDESSRQAFSSYVKSPSTLGRYKAEDLSIFDEADLERVRAFGYMV